MKKYYIAYFPEISENHWIQKFRNKFDDKSHLISLHITLFFPAEMDPIDEFQSEIERITANFKKFKVRFRSAMMMPEAIGSNVLSYIFLVPDEGFSDVLRLHDRLYSGKFAHLLRLDIPFVPHMTIGSNLSLSNAKKHVDDLNAMNFDFELTVDRISIVEINDPAKDRTILSTIELQ